MVVGAFGKVIKKGEESSWSTVSDGRDGRSRSATKGWPDQPKKHEEGATTSGGQCERRMNKWKGRCYILCIYIYILIIE